jgi:hypothetical protein
LTHLAFLSFPDDDTEDYPYFIRGILLSIPTLLVLITTAFHQGPPTAPIVGTDWVELAKIDDERLFVRPAVGAEGFAAIITSGATMWDEAGRRYKNWRKFHE